MTPPRDRRAPIEAVGVVMPVHNEERVLRSALTALEIALAHRALMGVTCRAAIVLDSCDDGTAGIAEVWHRHLESLNRGALALVIPCRSRNVGEARRVGCRALLDAFVSRDPRRVWLATTDADSEVPSDWLAVQLARHEQGFDFWAGRVAVNDWSARHPHTARAWTRRYSAEVTPIHGANLGVSASAYLDAGGFSPLRTGEDRAFHDAITSGDGVACYDHLAPVVTSARNDARAPSGFGHALDALECSDPGLAKL